MYASLCGNMRGPQVKTTLLLLLLTSLTGTVFCTEGEPTEAPEDTQEIEEVPNEHEPTPTLDPGPTAGEGSDPGPAEDTEGETDSGDKEEDATVESSSINNSEPGVSDSEGSGSGDYDREAELGTDPPSEDEDSSFIIVLIIAVLAVVILCMIVGGILFYRRRNKKLINHELSKEDPYLDGSSTEKVPMPMFEEDVPSVQELEMDELGQWMKKDDSSTAS